MIRNNNITIYKCWRLNSDKYLDISKDGETVHVYDTDYSRRKALAQFAIFESEEDLNLPLIATTTLNRGGRVLLKDDTFITLNAVNDTTNQWSFRTIDAQSGGKRAMLDGYYAFYRNEMNNYNFRQRYYEIYAKKSGNYIAYCTYGQGESMWQLSTKRDFSSEIVAQSEKKSGLGRLMFKFHLDAGKTYYLGFFPTNAQSVETGYFFGMRFDPSAQKGNANNYPFFENQGKIYVSTSVDLSEAVYLRVGYGSTGEVRFYFIDNVAEVQQQQEYEGDERTYELKISVDEWQTHFFAGNERYLFTNEPDYPFSPPFIKNATIAQSTINQVIPVQGDFPITLRAKGANVAHDDYRTFQGSQYLHNMASAVVVRYVTNKGGVICLSHTFTPKQARAHTMKIRQLKAHSTHFRTAIGADGDEEVECDPVDAIVVPFCQGTVEGFVATGFGSGPDLEVKESWSDIYLPSTRVIGYGTLTIDANNFNNFNRRTGGDSSDLTLIEFGTEVFRKQIQPQKIVNGTTATEWGYVDPYLKVVMDDNVQTGNEPMQTLPKVLYVHEGERVDISNNLTIAVPSGDGATYAERHKASSALSLMSGGIGFVASLASRNVAGMASSAIGIAQTVTGIEESKKQPWQVAGGDLGLFTQRTGWRLYTYPTDWTYKKIDDYINRYGFLYDFFTEHISSIELTNKYLRLSNKTNFEIVGAIQEDSKAFFKQEFLKGRFFEKR